MPVTAKVTSKGQVTIPKEVRDHLKAAAGSVLVFETKADHVTLRLAKTLADYAGVLKGRVRGRIDPEAVRQRAKAKRARRVIAYG